MSPDEAALIRLWQEKRGEAEPADLSGDLIVQLGVATEALNRSWYERNTERSITDVQRWAQHPVHRYLAATLDGFVNALDAVFEAKFMLPWSFSEEGAIAKHMAQLQHNMWVTNARFRDKLATLEALSGMEPTDEPSDRFGAATGEVALTANERFLSPVENPPFDPLLSKPNAGRRRVPVKVIRLRDKEHCKYVATQPCVMSGRTPAEAHHLRFAQPRALGRKVSDEYTVPVCRLHHRELHRYGDEASWWASTSIDPLPIALELWTRSR